MNSNGVQFVCSLNCLIAGVTIYDYVTEQGKYLTNLHTYFFTMWSEVRLEKLISPQLTKEFTDISRTGKCVTVFPGDRHVSLS
jgi:hypothetical protein